MPQLIVVGFVVFLQWLRRKLNKNFYKRMKKSEIFAGILADVSSEAEIDSDRILSSERKEEVVDARYLVIFLLLGNGFYPAMIAERMGLSHVPSGAQYRGSRRALRTRRVSVWYARGSRPSGLHK